VTAPAADAAEPSLDDVLDLEEIDRDLYRSLLVYPDEYALYGGQVAAQALLAAGRTVDAERVPHSLHCYFLRSGNAERPTVFRVDRDRDGRSFSARRVIALQGGEVLASMSCSFTSPAEGPDVQVEPAMVRAGEPGAMPLYEPGRLFDMECRVPPEQDHPGAVWPVRFWSRAIAPLPEDPLVHACVLTYLSDISSGVGAFQVGTPLTATSIDHAVWFHRPVRMDGWVLMDLVPHTLAASRGWYTGTVHDSAGRLAASLTQEVLARPRAVSTPPAH
jgi:acyl-CoA thioesterase-2